MGTLISLQIELNAIRSFLQNVVNSAEVEYSRIKALADAGKFLHYDDEANAYFTPEMWEKIAIHAALGELNALVEWELCNLANKTFFEKENASKKKHLRRANEIIERIESYYKIKFRDLKDYKQIKLIRSMVNSFKHRKGFKDYLKDGCSTLGAKFEVSRKEAFQSIDSVERFFKELWSNTGQTHMHNKALKRDAAKSRRAP